MARNTVSVAGDNSTDAAFQAWISLIPAILTAGGLVQTPDTGQANFSTLAKPTTANTSQGYQIWRSDDASVGNGLNNWYVKIEVGSSVGSATLPAVWLTFGWGSNGAGTITGNTISRTQLSTSTVSSAVHSNFWASNGEFFLGLFTGNTSSARTIVANVERTRTVAGVPTDEIFVWASSANGFLNHTLPRTGIVPVGGASEQTAQRNIPAAQTVYASNYGLSTIAPVRGAALMEANNIFGADSTNFTAGQSQHTLTVFGVTRTYILNTLNGLWASNYRLLSRYDT